MDYTFEEGYCKFVELLNKMIISSMRIGVAVSGGADSILMLHFAERYRREFPNKIIYFIIIHIIDGHHIIDESLKLYIFKTKALIEELQIRYGSEVVICENNDVSIFYQGLSIEEACHKLRKKYFKQIIVEKKLDKILVAHTEDDQIEHFFIALARKSSVQRLSGMDEATDAYIRPLLYMNKKNIRDVLLQSHLKFYDDPCNERISYLRNNIRRAIVSQLDNVDNRLRKNILAVMRRIKSCDQYIDQVVDHFFINDTMMFDITFFLEQKEVGQYKILEKILLKQFGMLMQESFYFECVRFLKAKKSMSHVVGKIVIKKKKNNFFLVEK